jgi:hypothetical protein
LKEPSVSENPATVEDVYEHLRALLGKQLVEGMAVVDVVDGEVSGVVLDETVKGGGYVDTQPLGDGRYLIIGLGDMPVKMKSGIHDL